MVCFTCCWYPVSTKYPQTLDNANGVFQFVSNHHGELADFSHPLFLCKFPIGGLKLLFFLDQRSCHQIKCIGERPQLIISALFEPLFPVAPAMEEVASASLWMAVSTCRKIQRTRQPMTVAIVAEKNITSGCG